MWQLRTRAAAKAQNTIPQPNSRCDLIIEKLEDRLLLRATGIDVSYYQGPSIDWASVKASGVSFAAIRSSTGSSSNTYNDPYLATNETNAQANGIITGVYHFAYPANNTAV